jgi:polyphosphate glucokinase
MTRASPKSVATNDMGPMTLAIDIGGTHLKSCVLDGGGAIASEHAQTSTPYPCPPERMVRALVELVAGLPPADRVSIGFPGVVRGGEVLSAPHFKEREWRRYPLQDRLGEELGKPARLLNDAEVQGLGVVSGEGLEVVLTLGTGVGSAVFERGRLAPHLELAHHPLHKGRSYNEYVGEAARRAISGAKWNRRVLRMIGVAEALLRYDSLYLGGGNSARLHKPLPKRVHAASNLAGLTGSVRLWDDDVWEPLLKARSPASA